VNALGLLYDIVRRYGGYDIYIDNEYYGFTGTFRDARWVVEEYFKTNKKGA
jgi:hypothetical protein